ncbi:MAG TPA: NAD(P)/FAD-dependent oxidoreductase [Candidatus Angelobacter sp.]|nr:NAD(P)/FAD-dependent oxidoreductase [Candidatus Angelobacter sp.]
MRSCDVLIVGAGPAGSSCAWGLRASGLDVVVLDKSSFPRDKICGGWITPFVLQALQIDPLDYGRGRTFQPISALRVSCLGQKEVTVDYGRPVSYGIRRREFDEYLLRRCGAEVRENVAIKSIERNAGGWIVNGEFTARLLIGAGGHFCPVARAVGGRMSEIPVVAQEIEFPMDSAQQASCSISAEAPELFFCRDLQGYGWCIRKGNFLNVGLGRLDQHRLSEHVSDFVQLLRSTGKIGFDLARRFAGHAYLLYGYSPRTLVDDGLMLIGDSAGLAYAQSGEGIRPAVESGLLSSGVVMEAAGDYSAARLARYVALLQQRFGAGIGSAEKIGNRIPHALRNLAGRILLRTDWFCRTMVVENWFLRMHDPPLPDFLPVLKPQLSRVAI